MKDKIISGILITLFVLYHLFVIYIGAHPDDFREGFSCQSKSKIITVFCR